MKPLATVALVVLLAGCAEAVTDAPTSSSEDAPAAFVDVPAEPASSVAEEPIEEPADDGGCNPSYEGACVPNDGFDHDCDEIGAAVDVVGPDTDGLDRDGDGRGCESYG